MPRFTDLLKEHDADKDGKLAKSEFPKDLASARRPEAGNVTGGQIMLIDFFDQLDISKDGKLGRFEWSAVSAMIRVTTKEHGLLAIRPGGEGDVTKSHVAWSEGRAIPEVPSPLAVDSTVVMVKNGGIVTCIDADAGKLHYRKRVGAAGSYYASPVTADGRIFLCSSAGVVSVIRSGAKFERIASNDLQVTIKATPAIAGDTIFVRSETKLHAFAEKKN